MRPQGSGVPQPFYGPDLPDDQTVNTVLDVALRIGEIQMFCGAGAADVAATIRATTKALGLPDCEADVIVSSISVTCHRGPSAQPVTVVRVVRSHNNDFSRLTATEDLVDEIVSGRIDSARARDEIRRIAGEPHPYPRWVASLAWGAMAGFIALIINGGVDIALAAIAITVVVDRTIMVLNGVSLPPFFQQVAGGAVVMLIATAVVSTGMLSRSLPTLLVAAAVTVLLSGMATVSAIQDAISGFNVTAAGRAVEVALMSAGLISGVLIALRVIVALGFEPVPLPDVPSVTGPRIATMMTGSIGAAACFAVASYSRGRGVAVAAMSGGIGGTSWALLRMGEVGPVSAAAIAAVLVGLSGGLLARRLRVTPLVAALAGVTMTA
ncbi:MAG: threonine/serine exporter family protein [Nocardiaceae bacterium]|nr:threonine/serine exporter family protein [Nocardiaceae bacterium]